jgi:acyl carrier protein phosphodiesterase
MNFLAHLHLGRHTEGFLLGSLLGDFIRGMITDDMFTKEVREGIRVHRAIDAFTDHQVAWKRSRDRLSSERRRFAGIIVDVFYDHFLSRHWDLFSPDVSREAFIAHCYGSILGKVSLLTGDVKKETRAVLRRVAREDWLSGYHEIDGIGVTLDRISRRSPRIAVIKGGVEELKANYEALEDDFLAFYPVIQAYVRGII